MIFYNGELYEPGKQSELMDTLEQDILNTLTADFYPKPEDVIDACDALACKVRGGEFDEIVKPFLRTFDVSQEYFNEICYSFSKEGLQRKVQGGC